MAKKIKRYNTGGVVERYSNPLFVQGMQGGLSAFGESSTSSVFGKGGVVDYVPKDKGNYFFRRFDGAIGSFGWEYNKKYNEGILYPLDDFDLNFTKIVKLKNGEVLFRYETDRMMGRMRPLIKFNLDKGLVYFGSDTEDGMPNFESRGIKANYIALKEDYKKYAKGGEVDKKKYNFTILEYADEQAVLDDELTDGDDFYGTKERVIELQEQRMQRGYCVYFTISNGEGWYYESEDLDELKQSLENSDDDDDDFDDEDEYAKGGEVKNRKEVDVKNTRYRVIVTNTSSNYNRQGAYFIEASSKEKAEEIALEKFKKEFGTRRGISNYVQSITEVPMQDGKERTRKYFVRIRNSKGSEVDDFIIDAFDEFTASRRAFAMFRKKYGRNSVYNDDTNAFFSVIDRIYPIDEIKQNGVTTYRRTFAKGGEVNQLPPKGELTNSNNLLLKYEKVGNNYEFFVYEPISREVSGYKQTKFVCKNSDCPLKMNYQQFINYLYSELYLDDKKYAKGGEVEITNETIDRGGLGSVQDNILANGGTIDAFEVGDIVTHKKGREYGHGKIYKISAIGIYLEDKYGNKREQPFYFPNDFKKVKKLMANGGNVDPHKFTQDSLLKKGGSSKSRVQILDDTKKFDASMYEGLLGDFDLDGLANVDDPNPIGVKNNESIEQVKFSKVFQDVLDVKEQKDDALKQFVDKLRKTTTTNEKIYGRTKTPYSILNKLVDKRLLHAKYGLMDLIGTTISFKNFRDLESYKRKVENGKLGRVIEFDDYYVNPNDGYRAYHFIIDFNGSPIELQLKTDRMKEINILSHDAYKHKVLNKPYMLYLTTLANNADNGDERASEEFLELMSRKDLVKKKLTLSSHK